MDEDTHDTYYTASGISGVLDFEFVYKRKLELALERLHRIASSQSLEHDWSLKKKHRGLRVGKWNRTCRYGYGYI